MFGDARPRGTAREADDDHEHWKRAKRSVTHLNRRRQQSPRAIGLTYEEKRRCQRLPELTPLVDPARPHAATPNGVPANFRGNWSKQGASRPLSGTAADLCAGRLGE